MTECGPLPYYHTEECRSQMGDTPCAYRKKCFAYKETKSECNHQEEAFTLCPYWPSHARKDLAQYLDDNNVKP